MSALPFTPLTITPRATESPRAHSPSQREGAGGWVPSVTTAASSPDEPDALSPSRREGAGGRADLDFPAPLPFTPSDQTAAAIIDDFAGQDETLRGIADKYSTTLESLTLWLARPDIAQRIHALESACATRARLVVANNLAAIANKLLHLLTESKLDHESIHRVPASTQHAFAARMQSRESARKTANVLLRIARYTPLPTHPTHPTPTPTPPNRSPTRKRGVTPTPIALQAPDDQQQCIAPPLPAQRGEDRLATGQATWQAAEGKDAHLSAHAVQYIATPTTNPTRKRGVTATHIAQQTPTHQQHRIAPPLPAQPEMGQEDRLPTSQATSQAPEGNQTHLNTHAVHYPAAPTTIPTRQRGITTTPHPPRAASCTSNKTTSSPQGDRPIARVHRDTS